MIDHKYNIGDLVDLKHSGPEETRLFITEIHTVTCSAGTQVVYRGKLWLLEAGLTGRRLVSGKIWEFNEIEILGIEREWSKCQKPRATDDVNEDVEPPEFEKQ